MTTRLGPTHSGRGRVAEKVREGGRVVNAPVLVATCVNADRAP